MDSLVAIKHPRYVWPTENQRQLRSTILNAVTQIESSDTYDEASSIYKKHERRLANYYTNFAMTANQYGELDMLLFEAISKRHSQED